MKINSLFAILYQLIFQIIESNSQPDKTLAAYFKNNHQIGSKERKVIKEVVFTLFREFTFDNSLPSKEIIIQNIKYIVIQCYEQNINDFRKYLTFTITPNEINELITEKVTNSPTFTNTKWQSLWEKHININNNIQLNQDVIEFLSKPNILYIRVNISKTIEDKFTRKLVKPIDFVLNELKSKNINFRINDFYESCIEILSPIKISNLISHKLGLIEVQDLGSQLICEIISPKENSRILDAAAGAGGKTLHIADLVNDNAEIVASDIELPRMKGLIERNDRERFTSIKSKILSINGKENDINKHEFYFDLVLLDCPCSGSGTIRRDLMLKGKISEPSIDKINKLQKELISYYSQFVKLGGLYFYATCSVFDKENQGVSHYFLNKNKDIFEPIDLKAYILKNPKSSKFFEKLIFVGANEAYILPNKFNSDGFYISVFKKVKLA